MNKFYNHLTEKFEAECTAQGGIGVDEKFIEGNSAGWYIQMGFASFNSRANNRDGYKTKEAAEAAVLRFQFRSPA